ncbi:MAG: 16S rRNA (adenine(1518)-N(6)/adenine(1519)-N(6))-dimethyltransferase RsmA [Desulfomonilaceae bacterium]|nr:16S rRNA (adenine(1518)-N(6)/adenine(1519)-N(6))-dimethyltransferase RsmA [Desulfomonilaceae bacterium]
MADARHVRKLFEKHGLSPKKWMGQNLLVDRAYLHKILAAARVQPDECIIEVGAGLGVLTEALLDRGAKVWALELDSGFFRVLQEKFSDSQGVVLVHADALTYDFHALAGQVGRLKVVANLPYNISSRLVFMFHENRDIFQSLYILLQKEVAQRLVAEPGTKDYGILTVLLGVSAEVESLFNIPPKAFFPVPEVISSLVRITFPSSLPVGVSDPGLLTRLVKAAFTGRRKTLKNTLKNLTIPGITESMVHVAAQDAGIDLARRGETLSPKEFAAFADALSGLAGPGKHDADCDPEGA